MHKPILQKIIEWLLVLEENQKYKLIPSIILILLMGCTAAAYALTVIGIFTILKWLFT